MENTAELAAFVAATNYDDLPPDTVDRAKLIVLDTVGVALCGSLKPEMQWLYERLPEGRGACLLRAGFPPADPPVAAFANATASCFLELDEGSRPTGHPAIHVIPSALALAQAIGASGTEFLTAVVLGYEVQSRVQRACKLRWPVHPHGNLGNAGAAAALGILSGWDAKQIRQGMNAAAGLAAATSWEPCFVGATVRNAYAGLTAQTAFAVKLLVESGFTSYDAALCETFGTILGDNFDPSALTHGLGSDFGIRHNYFKFHAACALVHPVLDALADALGATPRPGEYPPWHTPELPEPEAIRHVDVRVAERVLPLSEEALPNELSAKFSIPYAAAAYLVRGSSDPESFTGEALNDRQIHSLAKRVEVTGDPTLSSRWPSEAAASVRVQLADGRRLTGSCANPYGSGVESPPTSDLIAKFRALTAEVLSLGEQDATIETAAQLENVVDMSSFPYSS